MKRPHIKYSKCFRYYACRRNGDFTGYGKTPREAYMNWRFHNPLDKPLDGTLGY